MQAERVIPNTIPTHDMILLLYSWISVRVKSGMCGTPHSLVRYNVFRKEYTFKCNTLYKENSI